MTDEDVVSQLAALANAHRLQIFRLLAAEGCDGLLAGEIAELCGTSPSNLSFHLTHLTHAGLVYSRREGRNIRYSLNIEGTRGMLGFLIGDCCGGRPELCSPSSDAGLLQSTRKCKDV